MCASGRAVHELGHGDGQAADQPRDGGDVDVDVSDWLRRKQKLCGSAGDRSQDLSQACTRMLSEHSTTELQTHFSTS